MNTTTLGACALLLTTLALPAAAQVRYGNPPAVALKVAGPSANKIDIVFVGDGYAPHELGRLVADAQRAAAGLLQREPFRRRANELNFWVVNVYAPGGVSVFDVRGRDGVVEYVDRPLVREAVRRFSFFDGLDRTVLLVNRLAARSVTFTRQTVFYADLFSGFRDVGPAVVPAASGDLGYITMHELSHTMGNLEDEFLESPRFVWRSLGSPNGPRGVPAPNLTGNPNPYDPAHPFRRYFLTYSGVGLFRGNAREFVDGLYRLTAEACGMRNYGAPLCPVCSDVMETVLVYGRR